jgi:uncharacterized protein with PhoU and TrkA domain
LRLITIRRQFPEEAGGAQEHIIGVPKADMILTETDVLVVFGSLTSVERFLEING